MAVLKLFFATCHTGTLNLTVMGKELNQES